MRQRAFIAIVGWGAVGTAYRRQNTTINDSAPAGRTEGFPLAQTVRQSALFGNDQQSCKDERRPDHHPRRDHLP